MIILSGLGLHDTGDIPFKTLKAAEKADKILLESYTGLYHSTKKEIEKVVGKEIQLISRTNLEDNLEDLVEKASTQTILVLVPGDPLTATTHIELLIQARRKNVQVEVIHASSIYTAVAETGLQLYKFGKTTTLAFLSGEYKPSSPYKTILQNLRQGLHTLVLLDVQAEENRYMGVNEAIETLAELEQLLGGGLFNHDLQVVGCARLGGKNSVIKYGTIEEILRQDFGEPPHIIIIPAKLHFKEEEMLECFRI
jgi:diphthine synthase